MVSKNLVSHWIGMSKEEITIQWRQDQIDQFDEVMRNDQETLESRIVKNIEDAAKKGNLDAVQWLIDRGLLEEDGWQGDWIDTLKGIADRARHGKLDAVEWLEKHGLITLPSKPLAIDGA